MIHASEIQHDARFSDTTVEFHAASERSGDPANLGHITIKLAGHYLRVLTTTVSSGQIVIGVTAEPHETGGTA